MGNLEETFLCDAIFPQIGALQHQTEASFRNTDTSRGSVSVLRVAEVAPKCLC